MQKYHRFLDIVEEMDRQRWLVSLLDAPGSAPPDDVRFPTLRAGLSKSDWLRDQFQSVTGLPGLQDRIRRPVVNLLTTECEGALVRDRAQILGSLLEIAGGCGFTEVGDKLWHWTTADAYAEASYRLSGQRIPLRRTVWEILIAWGRTRDLTRYLLRDLDRPELDCAQLCFAELARNAPAEALSRIPTVLVWPIPYWREILRTFFSSLGARQALAAEFHEAWRKCFKEIVWNTALFQLLEPASSETGATLPSAGARSFSLLNLLHEVGLSCIYDVSQDTVQLVTIAPPIDQREIKLGSEWEIGVYDNALIDEANSLFTTKSTKFAESYS
ncbi:MAG: hypothetical protein M3O15_00835 [Acidobacteriota bacterium]|nr:hypothetical protein [Acidobacteriota bacterium]